VLGALGHGLAAPIVVGARNQDFSMLFKLAAPMALWLLWAAATAGRTVRRVAARTAVAEG
jgi:hypothetical protein